MRLSRQLFVLALPIFGVLLTTGARSSVREVMPPAAREREIERIRSHFDSVLTELVSRNVSVLSPEQRQRRADVITRLAAYRDRGVFPHNYDFPGKAVPYFVDRRTGTLCAVAHLMATDGHREIVDRVAAANNNVWVAELSGDTAFLTWLHDTGLTLAEAARIQVPYVDGGGPGMMEGGASSGYAAAYTLATTGALATTVVNMTLNRKGNSRVGNVLGFVLGATASGVGLAGARSGAPWQLTAASALVGVTSMGLSARGFVRYQAMKRQQAARAIVAPIVTSEGKAAAGMAVSIPF